MTFVLGECALEERIARCPVHVRIHRAWTPHQGGLPPFDVKPFTDRLHLSVRVHYTAIAGAAAAVRVERAPRIVARGRGHDDEPQQGTVVLSGATGYPIGVGVLTGLGLVLDRPGPETKYDQLGRYIGALRFEARDAGYDAATGSLALEYGLHVWLPDTVEDAVVTTFLDTALVQLGSSEARVAPDVQAQTSLCVASSDDAPAFSRWNRCGRRDTGPERSEAVEMLEVALGDR